MIVISLSKFRSYKLSQTSKLLFQTLLLEWFDVNGRTTLPWQGKNPYFVWISEIMLQQTQVKKVIDYFNRFVEKFPTLKTLAQADESQVLQLWSGLGYYNRARNLHKTAVTCQQQYNGALPKDLKQLMALPGIGETTAGAILSLASNRPVPILDGNVKRVISRVFAIKSQKLSQLNGLLWQKVRELMEQHRAADYNQALMDLGSMVCKQKQPDCLACPFIQQCQAYKLQQVDLYPQKKPATKKLKKTLYVLMLMNQKQVYLLQRTETGIWPKLWFLPMFGDKNEMLKAHKNVLSKSILQKEFSIQHILTHRHLALKVSVYTTPSRPRHEAQEQWLSIDNIKQLPHPRSLEKIIEVYQKESVNALV